MLAVRLALGEASDQEGPGHDRRTLVFDEIDAGIGGEAAVAVGRALADLARRQQVLVVTHLAQVAAFADQQIAVSKREVGKRTVADATALDVEGRIVELSRMLSGQPDSATARRHAEELLSFGNRS
jgi:DNA repair protein RecN (Recombination protein N)